jgi:hypothetical protein
MRRTIVAASLVLFGFAGSVLAEGTIVRWNSSVGTQGYIPGYSPDLSGHLLSRQILGFG